MGMSRKKTLVFIPMPVIGHVYSTVEMAKRLIDRDKRLSVTVLLMAVHPDSTDSSNSNAYLDNLAAAATIVGGSRIQFVSIPKDDSFIDFMSGASPNNYFPHFIEYHKPRVRDAVAKLVESDDSIGLSAFVIDMTFISVVDIASEFGVPSYLYFTSSAAFLGLTLHLQGSRNDSEETELVVPSYAKPVPARLLPSFLTDEGGRSTFQMENSRRFTQTEGIIINTFAELEPYALDSLNSTKTPTIYPVGPILNMDGINAQVGSEKDDDVITWLDAQPLKSVVFLCFGSWGSFGSEQAHEIARALEGAGHRFLWSLRQPASWVAGSYTTLDLPKDFDNVGRVLPVGFLDRTAKIGRVIGWAPQMAVLSHSAIGGFVSHCGWNSILESLWHGVPIATWPLYAEQQVNAFEIVMELGVAVELSLDYKREVAERACPVQVIGEEDIARAINCVMEQDSQVRKKVGEMKEASRKAFLKGGSSYASLGRFIDDVINFLQVSDDTGGAH